jgi:hypothetical protein
MPAISGQSRPRQRWHKTSQTDPLATSLFEITPNPVDLFFERPVVYLDRLLAS